MLVWDDCVHLVLGVAMTRCPLSLMKLNLQVMGSSSIPTQQELINAEGKSVLISCRKRSRRFAQLTSTMWAPVARWIVLLCRKSLFPPHTFRPLPRVSVIGPPEIDGASNTEPRPMTTERRVTRIHTNKIIPELESHDSRFRPLSPFLSGFKPTCVRFTWSKNQFDSVIAVQADACGCTGG